jgi:hypothetical protein
MGGDNDALLRAMRAVALSRTKENGSNAFTEESEEQDPERGKADLEKAFLTPSPRFSEEWLNKLQRFAHLSH